MTRTYKINRFKAPWFREILLKEFFEFVETQKWGVTTFVVDVLDDSDSLWSIQRVEDHLIQRDINRYFLARPWLWYNFFM